MKVIIAGSREFNDSALLFSECDLVLKNRTFDIEIVSGTARGADRLGEDYAKTRDFSIKQFHADWNKHGKSAGYIRNKEMAEYADMLIAFWDGKSRGTKHMIDLAQEAGLKIKVVHY